MIYSDPFNTLFIVSNKGEKHFCPVLNKGVFSPSAEAVLVPIIPILLSQDQAQKKAGKSFKTFTLHVYSTCVATIIGW